MESFSFSNAPKNKILKASQENEVSLNEETQESGKRENITLEIDGQTIEAVKYYFEYPERIQKETGILGYERIKINNQKLEYLKEIIPDPNNQGKPLNELVKILSDGEYPNNCITHKMSAFANKEQGKQHAKNFIDDKFFYQKIYHMDRIEKEINLGSNPKYIFNYSHDDLKNFSKDSDQPVPSDMKADVREIGEITKKELYEDNRYLIKDFNMGLGEFWHHISSKDIAFGFSIFNDLLFKEYLKHSTITLLKKIPDYLNNWERGGYRTKSSGKNMFALYLLNEYKNLGYQIGSPVNKEMFISKINNLGKDFLKNNGFIGDQYSSIKIGEYIIDKFFDGYNGIDSFDDGYLINGDGEIDIGIFINHDEIPQLSWGHAKYAHYFNDKSFNFFKFKHADHLPVKSDLEN